MRWIELPLTISYHQRHCGWGRYSVCIVYFLSLPTGLLLFVLAVFKWQPLTQAKSMFGSSEEPQGAVCSSQPTDGAASPPQIARIQPGFLLGRALLRHKAVSIPSLHIQAMVWSEAFIIISRGFVDYQQLIPQTRSPACLGFILKASDVYWNLNSINISTDWNIETSQLWRKNNFCLKETQATRCQNACCKLLTKNGLM